MSKKLTKRQKVDETSKKLTRRQVDETGVNLHVDSWEDRAAVESKLYAGNGGQRVLRVREDCAVRFRQSGVWRANSSVMAEDLNICLS